MAKINSGMHTIQLRCTQNSTRQAFSHDICAIPSLQPNKSPAKLNLLTCQVKPSLEDKKCFDLISRELTTHSLSIPQPRARSITHSPMWYNGRKKTSKVDFRIFTPSWSEPASGYFWWSELLNCICMHPCIILASGL